MNPLEILAKAEKPWTSQHEIMMRTMVVKPDLVPTILRTLEERRLAVSRSDDENGRVYQITAAGFRHAEEVSTQKRISSFPPPRSLPPVLH
jgi:DNA-binding PadR family transcriptional regulator